MRGMNYEGQIGTGTMSNCLRPTRMMVDVTMTFPDGDHTLVLRVDGPVWAWGGNGFGQFGNGGLMGSCRPVQTIKYWFGPPSPQRQHRSKPAASVRDGGGSLRWLVTLWTFLATKGHV